MRLAKKQQIEWSDLPTAEEYKKSAPSDVPIIEYREPKYQCPECAEGMMCKDAMFYARSYPTTYRYTCDKCKFTEHLRF